MNAEEYPVAKNCLQKLRFYSEEGFKGKPESRADKLFIHANCDALKLASSACFFEELKAILCGPYIMDVLLEFPDAFCAFIPEIAPMIQFDGRSQFRVFDIWGHTAHCISGIRPHPILRLVMLFHDAGKPQCFTLDAAGRGHFYGHPEKGALIAREALKRLGCEEENLRRIEHLVRCHDVRPPAAEAEMREYVAMIGEENIPLLLEIKMADTVSHHNKSFKRGFEEIARIHLYMEKLRA